MFKLKWMLNVNSIKRWLRQATQPRRLTHLFIIVLAITAYLPLEAGKTNKSAAVPALSPEEWLPIIEKDAAKEKARWNAQWNEIMCGAAIAIDTWYGSDRHLVAMKGERLRQHTAFMAAWKQYGGNVTEKVLNNSQLSTEEKPYRYIASGVLIHRYYRGGILGKTRQKQKLTQEESAIVAYVKAVEELGKATLIRGYKREALSVKDIHALRLYGILVDIRHTGNGVLPFHFNLTRGRYGEKGFRSAGEIAPDFALARMESFLHTPNYSDKNPWNPVDILTPLAAKTFLQIMCGFEVKDNKVVAKPYNIRPGHEDGIVRLSDYRGKKPVLLVFMNASDPRVWHGRLAPYFEPLKQAFGENMAFHFINTSIHDSRMNTLDFLSSTEEREFYVYETSMEHRARSSKMFYLDWPSCTTDYLLDDIEQHFRNEWMDQGGGAYIVVIDTNGVIAYTDYHQNTPPCWGKDGVNFDYEFLTIRMNLLESYLETFFADGMLYKEQVDFKLPKWRLPAERDIPTLRKHNSSAIWMSAEIISINSNRQEIVIERKLPATEQMKGLQFWNALGKDVIPFDKRTKFRLDTLRSWAADMREHPTYTIEIEETTDIFKNGRSVSLGDLEAGDRIGMLFYCEKDNPQIMHPMQIRGYTYIPTVVIMQNRSNG